MLGNKVCITVNALVHPKVFCESEVRALCLPKKVAHTELGKCIHEAGFVHMDTVIRQEE